MKLIPYSRHRRTVLHVDLDAPPQERWREAGEKLGEEMQEGLSEIDELIEEHLDEIMKRIAWPFNDAIKRVARSSTPVAGYVVNVLASLFGQTYQREIAGLARAAEVPFSQLLLGNLIYDISLINDWVRVPTACSSYSFELRGSPVLVRNMDWVWPDSIGRHTVIVEFHRGNRSYRPVGVAGMLKLLHPHRAHDDLADDEITPLVEFAVEMRKRTTDQLAKLLPSEFSQVDFNYRIRRRSR